MIRGLLNPAFCGHLDLLLTEGGQLTYLHTDHLGSVVLQTDTNGNVVNDQRYFAFGRRLDESGDISGEIDFTGQKQDATGLLYFNARYYDPQIGQFISPDTIVPDPSLLIDYNRYLYARGNPIKYNGPTGHCVWDGCILEAVLAAALIGATANATGNAVGQFIEQYDLNEDFVTNVQIADIDGREVGIAAAAGAIGGAVAPVTGPSVYVAVNAATGAGQKIATDVLIEGIPLEQAVLDPNTLLAAGVSAAGAKFGGQVPKVPTYVATNGETIAFATGIEAAAYGGGQYRSNTAKLLLSQQVDSMFKFRTIAGALAANTPVSTPEGCNGSFDCAIQFIYANNPDRMPPCTADPID